MPMSDASRVLVFSTCYNERDNIGSLIDKIVEVLPKADVLVVDDNSPDGTFEVVSEKRKIYPQVTGVQRPPLTSHCFFPVDSDHVSKKVTTPSPFEKEISS